MSDPVAATALAPDSVPSDVPVRSCWRLVTVRSLAGVRGGGEAGRCAQLAAVIAQRCFLSRA